MTRSQSGHLIVVLMVFVALMMIALLAAGQSWSFLVRRDAEAELIFRGKEYAEAILFYHTENKTYPLDLNALVEEGGPHRHRYIRKLYKDPIAGDGKWGMLYLSPTGQGFINPWGSPGAAGQLFAPEQFGIDPSKDRSGAPRGDTRDASGLPAGTAALADQQMEQFRGDVTGMPIVGVVHKKKETGIKLYNNIASLNDWAFVPDIVTAGLGVGGPGGQRPVVGGGGGAGVVGDSQNPIYLDKTKKPGYNPDNYRRKKFDEEERKQREEQQKEEDERTRRYNERRRQIEEEQAEEEAEHEEEPLPEQDPNAPEDEADPNAEQDPNAPADESDPNTEQDPNAPEDESDPNAEEEDPNSESGDGGLS